VRHERLIKKVKSIMDSTLKINNTICHKDWIVEVMHFTQAKITAFSFYVSNKLCFR